MPDEPMNIPDAAFTPISLNGLCRERLLSRMVSPVRQGIELSGCFVPCVRGHVVANDCARSYPGPSTYLDPRKGRHVDPGLRAVSEYGSELLSPATYPRTTELRLDLSLVKSEIGGYRACTKRACLTQNTVPDIGEMWNLRVLHHNTVLYLASRANLHIISQRRIRSQVSIRTYLAPLSHVNRPLKI